MRKYRGLFVLAAACCVGLSASAQSTVTIFGVMDLGISRLSATGGGNKTGLSSGNVAASRLGFRGTEDLGGGVSASFWLEGALTADDGTAAGLMFARRSTVSLSGGWGELRLGRDYTPGFWNVTLADPYGARGAASILAQNNFGFNTPRSSNTVGYFLPSTLGGVYGQLQYGFGEKVSTTPNASQGNSFGGRIGYANGPLDAALGYGKFRQVIGASDLAPVTIGRDLQVANILASWDFRSFKASFFYGLEDVMRGPASNSRLASSFVAIRVPVGAGEIRLTAGHYDRKNSANDFNQASLGYAYNLSTRTQLYATGAVVRNKGASAVRIADDGLALTAIAPGGRSNGIDLGIRHSF